MQHCREIAAERNLKFISSYDDLALMHGHATLGLEILDAAPSLDAVVLGVGGGGMLGGVALALDACRSHTRLIGVEPQGAAAMYRSLESGKAVDLDSVQTLADGLAAPGAGEACFEISKERVERIVLVSDDEIVNAMKLSMERCKLFVEPAGAAGLAGLLSGHSGLPRGSTVACIVSGGNVDLGRLKGLI